MSDLSPLVRTERPVRFEGKTIYVREPTIGGKLRFFEAIAPLREQLAGVSSDAEAVQRLLAGGADILARITSIVLEDSNPGEKFPPERILAARDVDEVALLEAIGELWIVDFLVHLVAKGGEAVERLRGRILATLRGSSTPSSSATAGGSKTSSAPPSGS